GRTARPRARRVRPAARAGGTATADQGLSPARRFCRRRRGDRRAIQHHRRLHCRQDRPRRRKIFAALRAPIERDMGGVVRLGSPALRLRRLAIYLAWTLLLMPVQALGLLLHRRWTAP